MPQEQERREQVSPQLEFVHKEHLVNGLEILVYEMPWAQSVSVQLLLKAGSRYENEITAGSAHYLEHMFAEGSGRYPSRRELDRAIESKGGNRINYSGDEYVMYQAKLPVENATFATKFIRELVFNPEMKEEAVVREKDIIAAELRRSIDIPVQHRHNLLREHIWRGHPLGRNILGTFESIQRIGRKDLLDYHSRFFRPDNAFLVVAGNITNQEAMDMAVQDFGDLPASKSSFPEVLPPIQSGISRVLVKEKDIQQTHILLAFSTEGNGKSSPLMSEIQVLSRIVRNNIFHSFVYEAGLSYIAGGYLWLVKDNGNIVIAVEVTPRDTDKAVERIVQEVNNLEIDDDLMQEAKASVISEATLNLADTDDYAHFIGEQQLYTGIVKSTAQVKEGVLAVTEDKVQELKQLLFTGDNVAMVVLGPISKDKASIFDQKLIFE